MGLLAIPLGARAQSAPVVSRPVVQSLPSAESKQLNAALARIARDPRDVQALIEAGDAANALGDPEAAAGFYNRADAISANNPQVKAGIARALVLQGNPTKAIPLFAMAASGASSFEVTSDRGLAYDLVGDPVSAQRYYRAALSRKDDDEVRRRLGVSLAISGDAAGSEAMLMPLLRKQDKPGWRSHAFALAIEGKTKEAVDTVNAILPPNLAQSVTPYLRYMPRLTAAQQAAAANLGKFPRASEIGRDDPAIAAYSPTTTRVASADAGLIPQGKPLGSGRPRTQVAAAEPLTRSQRRAREKAAQLARAEAATAARVAPPEPKPAIDGDGELPPVGGSAAKLAMANPRPSPAPAPTPASAPQQGTTTSSAPSATGQATTSPPRQALATSVPTRGAQVRTGTLALPSASAPATPSATTPSTTAASRPSAPAMPAPSTAAVVASSSPPRQQVAAAPGFDLARLGASTPASSPSPSPSPAASPVASPPAASSTAAPAASETPPDPVSLAQIFADLGAPNRAAAPISGAVDVRTIVPAKPEPEPAPVAAKPEEAKVETAKGARKPGEAKLAVAAQADAKKAGAKGKPNDDKAAAEDEDAATGKKGAKGKSAKTAEAKKADAKKAEAKKAPSHPSRIWVQIGVGRDMGAIAYDWRRYVKDNPALFKARQASTSEMGRTNRILIGPFETQKAAAAFVAQAKKADFDGAYVWTSPAGQAVDPLSAK